jgi:serine protease Do
VVSSDGYIVTNNHVVEEAGSLNVSFLDGLDLPARVVGRDPETDLALIKVESPRKLPVAPLGDSDQSRVGDWVIAIGNPLGLDHSVTVGILSAKGRQVNGTYDDYLQTDASINPGNSGGPLIDTLGRVVGINTMIRVYEQTATGIAFAIPISMAKPLLLQLRNQGKVTRGWLGIQFQPLTDALARGFELESTQGALVGDVLPGTPADKATIRSGDVIVEFGGQRIGTARDLPRSVAAISPGSEVDLVVMRKGKQRRLRAVVGPKPNEYSVAGKTPVPSPPAPQPSTGWGFEVGKLDKEVAKRVDVSAAPAALVVTKVDPDGPAFRAGLRTDDVILEVNGESIHSEGELMSMLERERPTVLRTRRGETTLYRALVRD